LAVGGQALEELLRSDAERTVERRDANAGQATRILTAKLAARTRRA
jgi:hypothetical protein